MLPVHARSVRESIVKCCFYREGAKAAKIFKNQPKQRNGLPNGFAIPVHFLNLLCVLRVFAVRNLFFRKLIRAIRGRGFKLSRKKR